MALLIGEIFLGGYRIQVALVFLELVLRDRIPVGVVGRGGEVVFDVIESEPCVRGPVRVVRTLLVLLGLDNSRVYLIRCIRRLGFNHRRDTW